MNTIITRWLSTITPHINRKAAAGIAGLAITGGIIAPATATATHTPTTTATVTAGQTGKPATDTPTTDTLIPHGTQGKQSRIPLDHEQHDNAKAIVAATKNTGMDQRAAVIAVATSLQESKLYNLGHLGGRNDHDSQGLFQQRPSSGWGSVKQITNPEYSTTAFLTGLKQVNGWRDMPLTQAAQKVQVSAYPFHYAQWETQAADIVADLW